MSTRISGAGLVAARRFVARVMVLAAPPLLGGCGAVVAGAVVAVIAAGGGGGGASPPSPAVRALDASRERDDPERVRVLFTVEIEAAEPGSIDAEVLYSVAAPLAGGEGRSLRTPFLAAPAAGFENPVALSVTETEPGRFSGTAMFRWDAEADLGARHGVLSAVVELTVRPRRGGRPGPLSTALRLTAGDTPPMLLGVETPSGEERLEFRTFLEEATGRVAVEILFRVVDAESDAIRLAEIEVAPRGDRPVSLSFDAMPAEAVERATAPGPAGAQRSFRFFLDDLPASLAALRGAGYFNDVAVRLVARQARFTSGPMTSMAGAFTLDLNAQPSVEILSLALDPPLSGIVPVRYRFFDGDLDGQPVSDPGLASLLARVRTAGAADLVPASELALGASMPRSAVATLPASRIGEDRTPTAVFYWDALAQLGDLPQPLALAFAAADHEGEGPLAPLSVFFPAFTTLATRGELALGEPPAAAARGDFDGDGFTDVAVSVPRLASVVLARGGVDGLSSGPAVRISPAPPPLPRSLGSGDFDGDGFADLIVLLPPVRVACLRGGPDGISAAPDRLRVLRVGAAATALAVVRLGPDEPQSVIVAGITAATDADVLIVLRGGAGGLFDPATPLEAVVPETVAIASGVAAGTEIAAADLDADGSVDVVVSLPAANRVLHVRGRPGGLEAAACLPVDVGGRAGAVAAADFDGDGLDEVLAAGGESVSVIDVTVGSPCAGEALRLPLPLRAGIVVAAELDCDGVADALVVDQAAGSAVSLSGGRAFPIAGRALSVSAEPSAVVSGDFDGDEAPETLIAGRLSDDAFVLRSTCSGPARNGSFAAGDGPVAAVTGDFNRDGVSDAAFANAIGLSLSFVLGGTQRVVRVRDFDAGDAPRAILSGDFDRDGVADLVAGNDSSPELTYARGGPSGLVPSPGEALRAFNGVASLAAGDFDGDGFVDAAAVSERASSAANFAVALGGASGLDASRLFVRGLGVSPAAALAAADFDGDGLTDLVVVIQGSALAASAIVCLRGGSGAELLASCGAVGLPGLPATRGLIAEDFTGDGRGDVAVVLEADPMDPEAGDGALLFWAGGPGGLDLDSPRSMPLRAGTLPVGLAAGDFTGDGFRDLLVAASGAGTVTLLTGGAAGFDPATTSVDELVVAGAPFAVVAADFDGDGFLDAAVAQRQADTVAVLRGVPGGLIGGEAAPVVVPVGRRPAALLAADFTGDGFPDLVVLDEETDDAGNNVNLLRGGLAGLVRAADYRAGDMPRAAAAGDFNGDGFLDLAVASQASDSITSFRQLFLTPHANVYFDPELPAGDGVALFIDPRRPARYRLDLPAQPFAIPLHAAALPATAFTIGLTAAAAPLRQSSTQSARRDVHLPVAAAFALRVVTDPIALLPDGQEIAGGATLTLRLRDHDPARLAEVLARPERLFVFRRLPGAERGELVDLAPEDARVVDFEGGKGLAFPISRLGTYLVAFALDEG